MTGLTQMTKPIRQSEIIRNWHLLDAKGIILGRLASQAAQILIGKHKINFVSYLDCGDNVVIINAANIQLSGGKKESKEYSRYSGYPGGLKKISFLELIEKNPEKILEYAVSGMLPDNKLKKKRMARLFVFKNENHPYGDKFDENRQNAKKT